MRIKIIIILFLVFKLGLLSAQQSADSIESKAKKLKQYYLLSKSKTAEVADMYEQKFFEEFPDNFNELNELYGDNEQRKKAAILNDEVENHIYKLFNNLKSINDTAYYKKIIRIAIGGKWDADAVNIFQNGLMNRVVNKPELTVFILRKMSQDSIKSFWYFYFDGPLPKKHFDPSLKKIKVIDKKIYGLMMESYDEVLKAWEKE